MGRPEGDSSQYQTDQPPQEYDLQPQEYQYESTHETTQFHEDHSSQTTETSSYYGSTAQQDPYQPPPPPQDPYQTPQSQQQQPPQQYPPQPQGYGAQPQAQPVQFPPQNNNPAFYSSSQTISTQIQPVQFPPQNLNPNQKYGGGPNQPAAVPYPPTGPLPAQPGSGNYPPPPQRAPPQVPTQRSPPPQTFAQNAYQASPQAVPFPPQNPSQAYNTIPVSPHKPPFSQAAPGIPVYSEGWRTGLFDCMDDPMNALVTAFFPCVTFGQVAEIVDSGHTSCGTSGMLYGVIAFCIAMPCIMSCSYRTKLRAKYGLVEAPAPDWVTHFFCEWCALCQEFRELQLRGIDPTIGWQGNLARMQQPQVAMTPPMNQRMMH